MAACIEEANIVGHVAKSDALPHPVQTNEICTFSSSLVSAVGENLLVGAGLRGETDDEGRALVAVRDLSKDIGVTNQADRRSILG